MCYIMEMHQKPRGAGFLPQGAHVLAQNHEFI